MAHMYYEKDCDLGLLKSKTIAVIGYGSQGHAHALNAKESGLKVIVGLYEGSKSWKKAEEAGFQVMTAKDAAQAADFIMILINDEKQAALYRESIAPALKKGKTLSFAHGFNIHFGQIVPPPVPRLSPSLPEGPPLPLSSMTLSPRKDRQSLLSLIPSRSGRARVPGNRNQLPRWFCFLAPPNRSLFRNTCVP